MVSHFKKKKKRSRPYPVEAIMDADYADDLVLLTNTLAHDSSCVLNKMVPSPN